MIQRLGGAVWRVRRGEDPEWFLKYQSHNIIPADTHASEWAWAKSNFDKVIANDGTMSDLRIIVDSLT
jgi:hypothetical protein